MDNQRRDNPRHSSGDGPSPVKVDPIQPVWLEHGKINEETVEWAQKMGKHLALRKLTSSTFRRFFGEMRRIQSEFSRYAEDVPLLQAKLAYDVGRKGNAVKDFYEILAPGIRAINGDEQRFNRFVKLAEALIAFHKFYYEGRDD